MFVAEQLKDVLNRDEVIISDYDGVMQLIDLAWVDAIKYNREHFETYFDFSLIDDDKTLIDNIINRPYYYLNKWLGKTEELGEKACEDMMYLYNNDPNFYEKIPFTKIATAYAHLTRQKFVKKIIFLSHYPEGTECDKRKEKKIQDFIKEYEADGSKIFYVPIPSSKSKGEWIAENCPEYTTFIDDRADIVLDVVKKTESLGKNFFIPRFGYSKLEEHEELLEKSKVGISINNYSSFV